MTPLPLLGLPRAPRRPTARPGTCLFRKGVSAARQLHRMAMPLTGSQVRSGMLDTTRSLCSGGSGTGTAAAGWMARGRAILRAERWPTLIFSNPPIFSVLSFN